MVIHHYIMVKYQKKLMKEMVVEFKYGMMVLDMKDIGKMIKQMEKGN